MYQLLKEENNKYSNEELDLVNSFKQTITSLFQKNEKHRNTCFNKLEIAESQLNEIQRTSNKTIQELKREKEYAYSKLNLCISKNNNIQTENDKLNQIIKFLNKEKENAIALKDIVHKKLNMTELLLNKEEHKKLVQKAQQENKLSELVIKIKERDMIISKLKNEIFILKNDKKRTQIELSGKKNKTDQIIQHYILYKKKNETSRDIINNKYDELDSSFLQKKETYKNSKLKNMNMLDQNKDIRIRELQNINYNENDESLILRELKKFKSDITEFISSIENKENRFKQRVSYFKNNINSISEYNEEFNKLMKKHQDHHDSNNENIKDIDVRKTSLTAISFIKNIKRETEIKLIDLINKIFICSEDKEKMTKKYSSMKVALTQLDIKYNLNLETLKKCNSKNNMKDFLKI